MGSYVNMGKTQEQESVKEMLLGIENISVGHAPLLRESWDPVLTCSNRDACQ